MDLSSEENIFISQPSRDNALYLLKLVDEMLISEVDHKLLVCKSVGVCHVSICHSYFSIHGLTLPKLLFCLFVNLLITLQKEEHINRE